MAISELFGAGLKSERGLERKGSSEDKCLASGAKYGSKEVEEIVGPAVRDTVPFRLMAAVSARGRLHPMLLRYEAAMTGSFAVHCSASGRGEGEDLVAKNVRCAIGRFLGFSG